MEVVGWLVIAADGYRSLFLDRMRAEFWATQCHGRVFALGLCDV
jgi:hypothetical protein